MLLIWLDSISRRLLQYARWWHILVWAAISLVCVFLFKAWLGPAFEAATSGYPIIDLQIPVQAENLQEQLPYYTAESRRIYWVFLVFDTIFPFTANLSVAILWACIAKYLRLEWILKHPYVLLLPFIGTVLDWSENMMFAVTIYTWPDWQAWAAQAGSGLRQVKLFGIIIKNGFTFGLLIWLTVNALRRFYKRV